MHEPRSHQAPRRVQTTNRSGSPARAGAARGRAREHRSRRQKDPYGTPATPGSQRGDARRQPASSPGKANHSPTSRHERSALSPKGGPGGAKPTTHAGHDHARPLALGTTNNSPSGGGGHRTQSAGEQECEDYGARLVLRRLGGLLANYHNDQSAGHGKQNAVRGLAIVAPLMHSSAAKLSPVSSLASERWSRRENCGRDVTNAARRGRQKYHGHAEVDASAGELGNPRHLTVTPKAAAITCRGLIPHSHSLGDSVHRGEQATWRRSLICLFRGSAAYLQRARAHSVSWRTVVRVPARFRSVSRIAMCT